MTTPAAMSHQSFRGNPPWPSTGVRGPSVGLTAGGLTAGGLAAVAGLGWASAELYGRRVIVAAACGVSKKHRVATEAFRQIPRMELGQLSIHWLVSCG